MPEVFRQVLAALSVIFVLMGPAFAVNPDEVLSDPVLEERARELSKEIRCLVCQNQSIDDSDAQLARDLRLLVREQLQEGKTDRQVLDFLVERYGEFVLLKPTLTAKNILLWAVPFLILVLGLWFMRGLYSRQQEQAGETIGDRLSREEKAELDDILKR